MQHIDCAAELPLRSCDMVGGHGQGLAIATDDPIVVLIFMRGSIEHHCARTALGCRFSSDPFCVD